MTINRWVHHPPAPCTCDALPQGFRLAAAAFLVTAVLTLGATLLLFGHPAEEILQLFGGLAVVASGLVWAATTGRRLASPPARPELTW